MQVSIYVQKDTNLVVNIAGADNTALYDTGTNISCISYVCYIKLKVPLLLKNAPAISIYSTTEHDFVP